MFQEKKSFIYLIKTPVCLLILDLICRSYKIKAQLLAPDSDFPTPTPTTLTRSYRKGSRSVSFPSEIPRTLIYQAEWGVADYGAQSAVLVHLTF